MSAYFPFRLAYRSAAARVPATEARRVALWHGEVIAQSNASLGKRRQDDWWTSGRLTMSTSAGRVRGVAGRRLSGSKTGRVPTRAARRYTTFRKVVCISCLCPWLMHPMQWYPCEARFCWQKEQANPSSKILTPNHIESMSWNTALERKVSWLQDGGVCSQVSASDTEYAVKRTRPLRSCWFINP